MGTSARWPGPKGTTDTADDWSRISRRLSAWRPESPDSQTSLEALAADHLDVLHRTFQEDPSAFGLYETACEAGARLTAQVDTLSVGSDFPTHFTLAVGGEGGTVADAAVRRAAASSAQRLLSTPEAIASGGGSLSGELFCLLYRFFFADVVAEFLRMVIAEKIKLTVPLLELADPDDQFADWVAEKVQGLLPNPCEEADRIETAAEKAENAYAAAEDPVTTLPHIAAGLVPQSVRKALGLITEPDETTEEPAV